MIKIYWWRNWTWLSATVICLDGQRDGKFMWSIKCWLGWMACYHAIYLMFLCIVACSSVIHCLLKIPTFNTTNPLGNDRLLSAKSTGLCVVTIETSALIELLIEPKPGDRTAASVFHLNTTGGKVLWNVQRRCLYVHALWFSNIWWKGRWVVNNTDALGQISNA